MSKLSVTIQSNVVWRYTAISAAFSLVVNLAIYVIGAAAGWIPDDLTESTQAFSVVSVILLSVIPVVLFGALMVYLANNAPRASRLFAMIVTIALVLAILFPLLIRDIDSTFRWTLIAMHIVTAGAILGLTQATRR